MYSLRGRAERPVNIQCMFRGIGSLGTLQPHRSQHSVGSGPLLIPRNLFTLSRNVVPLCTRKQPAAFLQSPVGSIAVVYFHFLLSNPFNAFTSSRSAAQLSLQKSKESVNDGLKRRPTQVMIVQLYVQKRVMCIHLFL